MSLKAMLRRIWHEKYLFLVLVVGICLVAGFFGLGPLYIRKVSEEYLRYILEDTRNSMVNVTMANLQPITKDVGPIIAEHIGSVSQPPIRINQATGPQSNANKGMICGLLGRTMSLRPVDWAAFDEISLSNLVHSLSWIVANFSAPKSRALVSWYAFSISLNFSSNLSFKFERI